MRYLAWLLFLVGVVGLFYYLLQWSNMQAEVAQAHGTDAYDLLYDAGHSMGLRAKCSAVICGLGLGILLWPRWSRLEGRTSG